MIWNTSLEKLQVYNGDSFKTITYGDNTLGMPASLTSVQVVTNGSIVVEVG